MHIYGFLKVVIILYGMIGHLISLKLRITLSERWEYRMEFPQTILVYHGTRNKPRSKDNYNII